MTRGALRASAPLDDPVTGANGLILDPSVTVDRLERHAGPHATLVETGADSTGSLRTNVLLFDQDPDLPAGPPGTLRHEVLVDGWRVVVELEPAARAALRERATRGSVAATDGGRVEVRAIIPGRVLSVAVAAGDAVVAGQQLLVVEAMKMQNELRAPRDGVVERVAVGDGSTIDLGDVLVVLS